MVYQSNSLIDTKKIAQQIAAQFAHQGGVVALSGELGAGKTTFVQFFAQSLGVKDKVISPTFVLIRQHQLEGQRWLYHADLYRLEDNEGIKSLGLEELLDGKNIVLIEWAEKMGELLPKDSLKIKMKKIDENKREITVEEK
jgi:tRNA threonylcarbamoyladenosine biosynthesis protein TsaE